MGRRIRKTDTQGELEKILEHCLGVADENKLPMTAIRIATAIDQCKVERAQSTSAASLPSSTLKQAAASPTASTPRRH